MSSGVARILSHEEGGSSERVCAPISTAASNALLAGSLQVLMPNGISIQRILNLTNSTMAGYKCLSSFISHDARQTEVKMRRVERFSWLHLCQEKVFFCARWHSVLLPLSFTLSPCLKSKRCNDALTPFLFRNQQLSLPSLRGRLIEYRPG